MLICYILWSFDIYFPVLVYCTKKNLATLVRLGWVGIRHETTQPKYGLAEILRPAPYGGKGTGAGSGATGGRGAGGKGTGATGGGGGAGARGAGATGA
jgi:hypothetical protein